MPDPHQQTPRPPFHQAPPYRQSFNPTADAVHEICDTAGIPRDYDNGGVIRKPYLPRERVQMLADALAKSVSENRQTPKPGRRATFEEARAETNKKYAADFAKMAASDVGVCTKSMFPSSICSCTACCGKRLDAIPYEQFPPYPYATATGPLLALQHSIEDGLAESLEPVSPPPVKLGLNGFCQCSANECAAGKPPTNDRCTARDILNARRAVHDTGHNVTTEPLPDDLKAQLMEPPAVGTFAAMTNELTGGIAKSFAIPADRLTIYGDANVPPVREMLTPSNMHVGLAIAKQISAGDLVDIPGITPDESPAAKPPIAIITIEGDRTTVINTCIWAFAAIVIFVAAVAILF